MFNGNNMKAESLGANINYAPNDNLYSAESIGRELASNLNMLNTALSSCSSSNCNSANCPYRANGYFGKGCQSYLMSVANAVIKTQQENTKGALKPADLVGDPSRSTITYEKPSPTVEEMYTQYGNLHSTQVIDKYVPDDFGGNKLESRQVIRNYYPNGTQFN
jgi:hypothetical protein